MQKKSYNSKQDNNALKKPNIQKDSIDILLINITLLFLGPFLLVLGGNGLCLLYLVLIASSILTILGLIFSIISFIKYRKKFGIILLNILVAIVIYYFYYRQIMIVYGVIIIIFIYVVVTEIKNA